MKRAEFTYNSVFYPLRAMTDGHGWIWGVSDLCGGIRWNEHVPFDTEADAIADAVKTIVQRATVAD